MTRYLGIDESVGKDRSFGIVLVGTLIESNEELIEEEKQKGNVKLSAGYDFRFVKSEPDYDLFILYCRLIEFYNPNVVLIDGYAETVKERLIERYKNIEFRFILYEDNKFRILAFSDNVARDLYHYFIKDEYYDKNIVNYLDRELKLS